MNTLFFLAGHSLRRHFVSTLVTAFSAALAVGLTMAVFGLAAQTRAAFMGGAGGFDAVLGARGSQLQLVLNAVFQLETSPGNIPWSLYQTIKNDPRVAEAVPYAVGDNYYGYRILGTILGVKDELRDSEGKPLQLEDGGQWFNEENREGGGRVRRGPAMRAQGRQYLPSLSRLGFQPRHAARGNLSGNGHPETFQHAD